MDFNTLSPQALKGVVSRLQMHHPAKAPVTFAEALSNVQKAYYGHSDFLAHYQRIDVDFVYSQHAEVYLVGFTKPHVELMAELFRYYGGDPTLDKYTAADQYILEGYGMFKSRAGTRIYRGEGFHVVPELRSIMRDIEVLS